MTLTHSNSSGVDPEFSEGGSESTVDLGFAERRANPRIVSLKQGSGGRSPPEAIGHLVQ